MTDLPELSVSEFVAVFNQTLEYAYPNVIIQGELANFRINRNRWVYFTLKDEFSRVDCFGSVYILPGPLENGMLVKARVSPRLHPNYGFSLVVGELSPLGSGSIKRMASLLEAKLEAEGLFSVERKRSLPYPPERIGLITSRQSAAYADFIKILSNRWSGIIIESINVSVQGDQAAAEIIQALEQFSKSANPPDVVVLIRGGGSSDELAVFSSEAVTRAVAASRVPTLVAIGHESDTCLAEMAADQRASTPSNAAELLVPDKQAVIHQLKLMPGQMRLEISRRLGSMQSSLNENLRRLPQEFSLKLLSEKAKLAEYKRLLELLNPSEVLKRGYAIVLSGGKLVSRESLQLGENVTVKMHKLSFDAAVTKLNKG